MRCWSHFCLDTSLRRQGPALLHTAYLLQANHYLFGSQKYMAPGNCHLHQPSIINVCAMRLQCYYSRVIISPGPFCTTSLKTTVSAILFYLVISRKKQYPSCISLLRVPFRILVYSNTIKGSSTPPSRIHFLPPQLDLSQAPSIHSDFDLRIFSSYFIGLS